MRLSTVVRAAATLLASTLLVGCPGDDSNSGPETYAEFCRAYATALSSRDATCGTMAVEAVPFKTAQFERECVRHQGAVEAGRVNYDAKAAAECLSAISSGACSGNDWIQGTCTSNVVSGAVGAGGACRDRAECADGTRCIESGGDVCAFGTCEALVALEASCDYSQRCVPGAECFQGTCQPLVAISGDCSGGRQCVTGARCLNNVCEGPAGINESCAQGRSCVNGALCFEDVCRVPVPAGSACDSSTPCETGLCLVGKCLSLAGPGQHCGLRESTWCQRGYYCSGGRFDSGNCVASKTFGSSCTEDLECAQGLDCTDGRCVSDRWSRNLGESCGAEFGSCKDGLRCSEGTCAMAPKLTEPCSSGPYTACLEGYCSGWTEGICTAYAKLNESCASNRCEPHLECDTGTITCIACP